MRLVFFGTPDFASRCLEKILNSQHEILAVVTAPDKPKGRGMKIEPSEVKILAQRAGLEIMQPVDLLESGFISPLKDFKADIFCVVAFRILPEEVFSIPRAGTINLHGSLLPKFRGAAPINWALINGETETGLTTFFIRRKVDTGDILLQEMIPVGPDETFGELYDRMADCGGDLILKTIDLIDSGNPRTVPQDNSLASAAPKITPELGNIDWSQSAGKIHNLVRGLSPKPGAYSYLSGKKIIFIRTRIADDTQLTGEPGAIIQADPVRGIMVAAGKGALEIMELRPESGKTLRGAEYVRGHKFAIGETFKRNFGK